MYYVYCFALVFCFNVISIVQIKQMNMDIDRNINVEVNDITDNSDANYQKAMGFSKSKTKFIYNAYLGTQENNGIEFAYTLLTNSSPLIISQMFNERKSYDTKGQILENYNDIEKILYRTENQYLICIMKNDSSIFYVRICGSKQSTFNIDKNALDTLTDIFNNALG